MPNEPLDNLPSKLNIPQFDLNDKSNSLSIFEMYSIMDLVSLVASAFMVFGGVGMF